MGYADWLRIADDHGFGVDNLPLGVFSRAGGRPRTGVRVGDRVLDLAGFTGDDAHATGTLNAFLARGPAAWATLRAQLTDSLSDAQHRDGVEPHLVPLEAVTLHLPIEVADYVDFYSSRHHAENVGRIFRPGAEPLTPNWTHLPIGYHGRAGTVRVSGTEVTRPAGQRRGADGPTFGPTLKLDFEAEVGFVVGAASTLGAPIPIGAFTDHVFGVCLVNDWSARDIQSWEYVPLGPFLGKSFLTSVSPWVVPLAALENARVAPPPSDPLPYLCEDAPWGLDITLDIRVNDELVSSPPFRTMSWTPAQQLAHLTVNGAAVRTGDLYASGTVSGPQPDQVGSLLELSWDGSTRGYLMDGDDVRISASAPGDAGGRVSLGEVAGRVIAHSS